jgi:hypothetical protein
VNRDFSTHTGVIISVRYFFANLANAKQPEAGGRKHFAVENTNPSSSLSRSVESSRSLIQVWRKSPRIKRLLGGLPKPEPCTESISASIFTRLQQNHGNDSVMVIAFGPLQLSVA